MTAPELLVERFIGILKGHQEDGAEEWVTYTRVEDDTVEDTLESAVEAGRRLGATIYAAVVPDDYDAPVRALDGQTVLRIADTPAPWTG
jgi:hypothetical protein